MYQRIVYIDTGLLLILLTFVSYSDMLMMQKSTNTGPKMDDILNDAELNT